MNWRFISGNEYEFRDDPTDPTFTGVPEGHSNEAHFGYTDKYNLFDLSIRYQVMENLSVTGVISNLFDKQPPLTGAFIGATGFNSGNTYPSTYDGIGRRFSLSARVKF